MDTRIRPGLKIHIKSRPTHSHLKLIVLFVLILLMAVNVLGCKKSAPVDGENVTDSGGDVSNSPDVDESKGKDMLPQLERPLLESGDDETGQGPMLDPFSGSLTLTGILTSKFTKDNIAIIEYGNTSYIVNQDDIIAEYWKVGSIKSTGVLLKHDDVELILEFSGK